MKVQLRKEVFISGKRTYLRKPQKSDQKELIDLVTKSARFHAPWVSPPNSPKKYLDYLTKCDGICFIGFFICRKHDDKILGVINMSHIVRGALQSAFLGFYIGAEYSGQGYMSEGLQLVTRYAFQTMKLHRLEANIRPVNKQSLRLVKSVGFNKEGFSPQYLKIRGRWRDHERWAILRE